MGGSSSKWEKELSARVKDESLDLSGKDLGDKGAKALSKFLSKNASSIRWTSLNLTDTHIDDEGLSALSLSLTSNSTLVELILCKNYFGLEGAKSLALMLTENTTLERLDLGDNLMHANGCRYLIQALAVNSTLQKLGLSANSIGDAGAGKLFNRTQSDLHLKGTRKNPKKKGPSPKKVLRGEEEDLEEEDEEKEEKKEDEEEEEEEEEEERMKGCVGCGLEHNTVLFDLDLHKNNIGNEGGLALLQVLKGNFSLIHVNLFDNNIPMDVRQEVKRIAERNKGRQNSL